MAAGGVPRASGSRSVGSVEDIALDSGCRLIRCGDPVCGMLHEFGEVGYLLDSGNRSGIGRGGRSPWTAADARLLAGRPGGRPRGVPSMGSVLLDERSQSGPMTATVAKPQGATARGKPKEAGGKLSTVGTRTGSEAGCGRQAGPEQRSPKVIKTHQVEPDGAREQSLHLTWGDLLGESRGEVRRVLFR